VGDKFKVFCYIDGYDIHQHPDPQTPTKESDALTSNDLTNGYIDVTFGKENFLGLTQSKRGRDSKMQIQYFVESAGSYSDPTASVTLSTVPAGGV
jgi:hypothetical protein